MGKLNFLLSLSFVFCFFIYPTLTQVTPFWGYNCIDSRCVRVQVNESNINTVLSLNPCVMICNEFGTLWPQPTNVTTWNTTLLSINRANIMIQDLTPNNFASYWNESMNRFNRIIDTKIGDAQVVDGEYGLTIFINVQSFDTELDVDTDEQYQLQVQTLGNNVQVLIRSYNYFGARHALETLSQLIVFDEFSSQLMIMSYVSIIDAPAYKHRGILLDTSRRWFSIDAIKRILDVMAMSKLNVFHWHFTNAHSFAMVLDSHPELSQMGAFSPSQVYHPSDIREVVEYGRVRGVRILPEFDSPAHLGEGFQNTNFLTCYKAQPWEMYCSGEPPCGQLDSTKEEAYEFLQDIFTDINEIYDHPPQFHVGGWGVNANCWNTSEDVRNWMIDRGFELTDDGYLNLLAYHLSRELAIYRNITSSNRKPILWNNEITREDVVDDHLGPDDYVVQMWFPTSDVPHLLERGFELIISNMDSLYLDCGFGSHTSNGSHWCSPYSAWHRIYDNDIRSMVGDAGNRTSQILGGEVVGWSIPFDESTLDAILWPRASAHGERMWSDPSTNFRGAEFRIYLHREFLVRYGINAESLTPEWCVQNLGECRSNN